jgi:hypothetical protein
MGHDLTQCDRTTIFFVNHQSGGSLVIIIPITAFNVPLSLQVFSLQVLLDANFDAAERWTGN